MSDLILAHFSTVGSWPGKIAAGLQNVAQRARTWFIARVSRPIPPGAPRQISPSDPFANALYIFQRMDAQHQRRALHDVVDEGFRCGALDDNEACAIDMVTMHHYGDTAGIVDLLYSGGKPEDPSSIGHAVTMLGTWRRMGLCALADEYQERTVDSRLYPVAKRLQGEEHRI